MKVFEHVPLSDIAFYKIGGKARFVIHCEHRRDILDALQFIRSNSISQLLVLGLGSNILLPDTDFDGAILLMRGLGTDIQKVDETKITSFAGESMDDLIQASFKENLLGLAWAGGLPSTVGGAIRGNAGAFGSEVKDTVDSVEVIDTNNPQFPLTTITKDQAAFSYRNSYFKMNPNLVIVSGTFALQPGTDEEMRQAKNVYLSNIAYRQKNHPVEYPSCGSVFKNITDKKNVERILSIWPDVRELSEKKWHNKVSMGYIINRLGFSGKQIGGAQVSTKHTNYIVNIDHATSRDVRSLIEQIQQKFEETFGFIPEPEVMIVKSFA